MEILNGNGEQILTVKHQTNVHCEDNLELIIWNSCATLKEMYYFVTVNK